MIHNLTAKSIMQGNDSPPIVENANLPQMEDILQAQPASMSQPSEADEASPDLMPPVSESESSDLMPPVSESADQNLMSPVSESESPEFMSSDSEVQVRSDQEQRRDDLMQRQLEEDKYIRLQLRIENGELSVVSARAVEGPLLMEKSLQGELIYEVMSDQKRIAVGSLPNLGEVRGLPHPEGVSEQQVHHITQMSSDEFTARIPQRELSLGSLSDVQVAVYRVKGRVRTQPSELESLNLQFSEQLREVARLRGIRLENLSVTLQEELRQALQ